MPQNPEQPPKIEIVGIPFLLSSRFASKEASQAPYDTIQQIAREREVEFSVFRLIQNWPESMSKAPPSNKRWYLAIIGDTPPEPIARQVRDAINQGEPVPQPDEVISLMVDKRLKEIAERPFTEIHRTPKIINRRRQFAKCLFNGNLRQAAGEEFLGGLSSLRVDNQSRSHSS